MDDKSTPIASLNNKGDESEVVNQILTKYNDLQDGQTNIPPINPNINEMENQFENRNLNKEIYDLSSNNVPYQDHYQKEVQRANQYNDSKNQQYDDNEQYEDDDGDEYEEYEVIELPLWKRVLNELRIPFYIFIFIILFFNGTFDKFFINKVPFFGNQYNEINTYGFLLKVFIISLLSYLFIRFVRF
jgi:hypothetical protein